MAAAVVEAAEVREEQEVAAPGAVGEVLGAGPVEAEVEVQAAPGGRAVPAQPAEVHGEGAAA